MVGQYFCGSFPGRRASITLSWLVAWIWMKPSPNYCHQPENSVSQYLQNTFRQIKSILVPVKVSSITWQDSSHLYSFPSLNNCPEYSRTFPVRFFVTPECQKVPTSANIHVLMLWSCVPFWKNRRKISICLWHIAFNRVSSMFRNWV